MTVSGIFTNVSSTTASTFSETQSVRSIPAARFQRLMLIATDAVLLLATMAAAVITSSALRASGISALGIEALVATTLLFVLWLVTLRLTGAYSIRHLISGSAEYKRAINASVIAASIFGIACYLLRYDYPRLTFVFWMVFGVLFLCIARFTRRHIMHRLHVRGLFQTPVLVAGSDHHVDEVTVALRRERWTGFKVVGALTREDREYTPTGLPVLGEFDDIVDVIKSNKIATVIFAEGSFDCPSEFRRLAWKLEQCQVQMMVVPTMADVSAERLDFSPMAGLPLVSVARPRALHSLRWSKRAADVVGSALLLLMASPILMATALAIRLEDGGPVLFRQPRIGLNGKMFDCLKFRSMCIDAEARIEALQAQNEGSGVLFKMANDPRITTIGRHIRRFSIDELPQLWNTLRGDMSLVGPRPALPREVAQYDDDTKRRLDVRPGLTGLWQVSGRSNLSWENTVRLDLYYVDNWSAVQDLMILAKTARAVLGSDGAY